MHTIVGRLREQSGARWYGYAFGSLYHLTASASPAYDRIRRSSEKSALTFKRTRFIVVVIPHFGAKNKPGSRSVANAYSSTGYSSTGYSSTGIKSGSARAIALRIVK